MPIATPPIAALYKKANNDPEATDPNDAYHPATILPATGPTALNPIAPRIAGVAQLSAKSVLLPKMTAK
ncbi:MAG: hypothetical protein M1835_003477, partial [Candelina submexicana]